ncbi:hypothetical protein FIBSPDRAFT_846692 [Athelia psychrophila]|uniref:Uncharacterized protein n=1 Tax=Athelia psychrophila TaxID=1759441 RepID=A0A166XB13_9AGAM|nr:hypothetical protein FIBSPDRAFT_846692 [Fibularhizoctonia sp. CBS 109695]
MTFSLRAHLLERKTFCCCLPVRVGAIAMSLLTMLLSGAVSLFLWVQVSEANDGDPPLDQDTVTAYILTGVVQTLLFVGSILGFLGAIVRKQSFVQIYSWFIWIHLFLSLAAGSFFIWTVTHTIGIGEMSCKQVIPQDGEQQVCSQVLSLAGGLLIGVVVLVWLVEIYGALIIARYSHNIRKDKLEIRRKEELQLSAGHPTFSTSEVNLGLLAPPVGTHHQDITTTHDQHLEMGLPVYEAGTTGYGGGQWSLQEASAQEKRQLREAGDMDDEPE